MYSRQYGPRRAAALCNAPHLTPPITRLRLLGVYIKQCILRLMTWKLCGKSESEARIIMSKHELEDERNLAKHDGFLPRALVRIDEPD